MPPTLIFQPLASPSLANDNGVAITQLFKDGGPGTTVLLVQRATYVLYTAIDFVHPQTTLATVDYPTFDSGNQAILETRGEKEAGAINMYNKAETSLKRLHIRGCRGWGRHKPETKEEEERLRQAGGHGWVEGGGALVWMGGPESHDSMVEGCRLEDPRGWTAVHVCDWALRAKVIDSLVGPCGQEASGGPWADGLSVAGKDSLIAGNTIFDATDGAIVVFCAPGSTIANNTIIARERDLLGAINMVDDFPFDRNFTDTRVVGNTIRTEGAYIRLGIGCGPTCWSPWQDWHTMNYGGSVLNNYFGPGNMGYAIGLSGVKSWTVLGNTILPSTRFTADMSRQLSSAPPTAFICQWEDHNRTQELKLQDGFVEGQASWLISVEHGVGDKLLYEGGQLKLNHKGESSSGEGGISLRGARWSVSEQGELVLRKDSGDGLDSKLAHGPILWSSGNGKHHGGKSVEKPHLDFSLDGRLAVRSHDGHGESLWDPTSYLVPYLDRLATMEPLKHKTDPPKWALHPSLLLTNTAPFLTLRNKDNDILFSTSYDYTNQDGWAILGGQWIAVAPPHLRGLSNPAHDDEQCATPGGPPPIPARPHHFSSFVKDLTNNMQQSFAPPPLPPRPDQSSSTLTPTFLFLNPVTAQLTLHSSPSPAHPLPEHTHWVVPKDPVENITGVFCSFQGDGNVVTYAQRGDDSFVPWASMTNGDGEAHRLVLKGVGEEDGPAFELWAKAGHRIFTSKQ